MAYYTARPLTDKEIQDYMADGYQKIDEYDEGYVQLVKPITDNIFLIVDNACQDHNEPVEVDLDEYSIEELEEVARTGYDSLKDLRESYGEDEKVINQVLAELIVELRMCN